MPTRWPTARGRIHLLAVVAAASLTHSAAGSDPWREACLQPMATSPSLASACDGIHSSFDCARAVERRQLAQQKPRFARDGGALTIRTDAGPVVLRDEPREMNAVYFSYIEYLSELRQHLVNVHDDESDAFLLVDARSGAKTMLAGPPIVSPDGTRLACARSSMESHTVEIWRRGKSGFEREWSWEPPGDWDPGTPHWSDPSTVRVPREPLACGDPPGGFETLTRRHGRWTSAEPGADR